MLKMTKLQIIKLEILQIHAVKKDQGTCDKDFFKCSKFY